MKDEMDILREVGCIAAAHGSIALSEILGREIKLNMPSLDFIPGEIILERVSQAQIVIGVYGHILSGLKGNVLFILDEKSAFKLVDLCYKIEPEDKKSGVLTEMGLSVIKEVGNVVIASCIGALSIILKNLIIPSIPTLISGPIQQIMNMAISKYYADEYVLLVEAVFEEPNEKITGSFYLVLGPETTKYIQETCKKYLTELE